MERQSADRYRGEIDGLRAIAVMMVVAYHLTFTRLAFGGFVGVDVFYVISGYLVTAHLRRDLSSGYGGIAAFYRRRVIRIFPALFVLYLGCCALQLALMFPSQLGNFRQTLVSSVLFVSNHYLFATTGYFDFSARLNPLIHTWSLSIEEQFYFVLPFVLLAIRRMPPGRQMLVLLIVAVASLIGSQALLASSPRASFYLLPLRAWELLAGSLLSYSTRARVTQRWLAELMGAAGVTIILASGLFLSPGDFPGVRALPPVIGTMLVLAATEEAPSLAKSLLSVWPARFLGKISYSLYLWHWPLIVYSQYLRPPVTRWEKLGFVLFAIVVAWLSWLLVEQPVRKRRGHLTTRTTLTAGAVAMGIAIAVALLLPRLSALVWPAKPAAEAMLHSLEHYDEPGKLREGRCFLLQESRAALNERECLTPDPARPNVLLIGDSHAADLWDGLRRSFPQVNFLQATMNACTPLNAYGSPRCGEFMDEILDHYLPAHPVDALLISGRWSERDISGVTAMLARAKARAARVILVGPVQEYNLPLTEALARAQYRGTPADVGRYRTLGFAHLDALMRAAAAQAGVDYVSPMDLLCPGACLARDGAGGSLMYDNDHLTAEGGYVLAERMPRRLFDRPAAR